MSHLRWDQTMTLPVLLSAHTFLNKFTQRGSECIWLHSQENYEKNDETCV